MRRGDEATNMFKFYVASSSRRLVAFARRRRRDTRSAVISLTEMKPGATDLRKAL
jgi:hypothetical protein